MPVLTPGRIYPGMLVRITGKFIDLSDDSDTDPTTITFKLLSPDGIETSYVYGTDSEVQKESVGDYTADIRPTYGGRWRYRWEATKTASPVTIYIAGEGNFVVQSSSFSGYEDVYPSSDYS